MNAFKSCKFWLKSGLMVQVAVWLASCSLQDARETLGMSKQAPDEYLVVERAPLSLPPNFELRPPTPGAVRAQYVDLRRQAEQILLGLAEESSSEHSTGEMALLAGAGATNVDVGIRQTIDRENGAYMVEDDRFVADLMFWEGHEDDELIIDPVAEAERLRKNASLGLPVTYGESPTIRRKE